MNVIYELLGKDMRAFQGSVGKAKRESGHRPCLPVLIVPGLCSSALGVEAGYQTWIGERIWLSVAKMGLERLRWGTTKQSAFVDPEKPPFTPGMFLVRHGIIFHSWEPFWFCIDVSRKALFYFAAKDVEPQEGGDDAEAEELRKFVPKKGARPAGTFIFDHRTTISFSSHKPKGTSTATKSLLLRNQHISMILGTATDGLAEWRYTELFKLLQTMFPERKGKPEIEIAVTPAEERKDSQDFALKNLWLKHMMLDPKDGVSDPPHVRVRAEEGIGAIDYLDPGTFVKEASYVFGPVLANLKAMGYTDDMISAMSYDWRLPPYYLQQRDNFFWKMKAAIEELKAKNNGKRVVVLAHSLGNCVVNYFLSYILRRFPDGQQWLDEHVHTFFAVGAPWLGAPKSVRGLVTGDKMGLEAFITMKEATMLARSWASAPWLFPASPELHFSNEELKKFAHIVTKEGLEGKENLEALTEGGADQPAAFYRDYYAADPLVTSGQYLEPPTVKLLCLYGVNLDTEVSCLLRRKGNRLKLEKSPREMSGGYRVEGGIVFETAEVRQTLRELAGADDVTSSGDGTVPYASLAYPHTWKLDGKDVHIVEIDGAPHREVLEDRTFLAVLLDYVSKPHVAEAPEEDVLEADPMPEPEVVIMDGSADADADAWFVVERPESVWEEWPSDVGQPDGHGHVHEGHPRKSPGPEQAP